MKPGKYLKNYIPLWVFASMVMAVLAVTYSGFRYWLYEETYPVANAINEVVAPEISDTEAAPVLQPVQPEQRFY